MTKRLTLLLLLLAVIPWQSFAADVPPQTVFVTIQDTLPKSDDPLDPGPRGVILPRTEVEWQAGDTMMDAITKAANHAGLDVIVEGGLLLCVDGLSSGDRAAYSGWTALLNDWFVSEAMELTPVQPMDEIVVAYTLTYSDLGGVWGDNNTSLLHLSCSNGRLVPAFRPDIHDYTLLLPSETEHTSLACTAANKNYQVRLYRDEIQVDQPGLHPHSPIPVTEGGKLIVGVGDPSWPTMNDPKWGSPAAQLQTYTLTVKTQPVVLLSQAGEIQAVAAPRQGQTVWLALFRNGLLQQLVFGEGETPALPMQPGDVARGFCWDGMHPLGDSDEFSLADESAKR